MVFFHNVLVALLEDGQLLQEGGNGSSEVFDFLDE
jgi:hypothetical protein